MHGGAELELHGAEKDASRGVCEFYNKYFYIVRAGFEKESEIDEQKRVTILTFQCLFGTVEPEEPRHAQVVGYQAARERGSIFERLFHGQVYLCG